MWSIFSLLSALFESSKDVFSKKSLENFDEYIASISLRIFAFPVTVPILFYFGGIPEIKNNFWPAWIIGGALNVIATVLFMRAIKSSDLSLTVPMISFTPLFLLLTSPIMVGEFPSAQGIAGVILIVFGAYLLKIKERHAGYLAPFRALLREKGPRLMLAVAFIWSITSNFDKIGVQGSSPLFWTVMTDIFIATTMAVLIIKKSAYDLSNIRKNLKSLVPIGLFNGLSTIFQMTAVSMAPVSYVIAIKRTSILWSVLLGKIFFKEAGLKERLPGAALMVAGAIVILTS